jgi:hypothetical protein
MKHGVSKWLILCSNCTKTHLRASVDQKKFFRLAIARHEGRGGTGRGKGGGVRGRPRGRDNGRGWEGKGRRGEGKAGGQGAGEGPRGGKGRGKKGKEWDPQEKT